jgi:N-acetylmuramoyl-L-alanine amidase
VTTKGIVWFLLAASLCVTDADAASRPSGAIQISGKTHLPVKDWARTFQLEVRWLKGQRTLQLSKGATKILLDSDSREAQVNGVQVWLLFPFVNRNGTAYLAQLDAETTLQPLLAPPKNRPGATLKTICLDPGHGGKDPGNRVGSYEEKKYTLLLAQELRQQLSRAGIKANLTRSSDSFIELPSRPELARRRKADLFVSLHFNATASSRSSVRGAEVYCLTPAGASSTNARGEGGGGGWFAGNHHDQKNMALAYQVQKSICQNLEVEDRGVRRARFAVLRDATMPAILIEAGFMSHPVEGKKIFDAGYRRQMAKAIVDGLLAYKRGLERPT